MDEGRSMRDQEPLSETAGTSSSGPAVGDIAATAQSMTRTQRLIDRAQDRYVLLGIQTRGRGRVAQGDRRSMLNPGDCTILESHRAFDAGFGDLSGFNRAFKAKYGISPRELRLRGGAESG